MSRFVFPEASGTDVSGTDTIHLDASHTENGYFILEYTGDAPKIKLQVTPPTGVLYTYTLLPGDCSSFSLGQGDGTYHIEVLENAYENMYSLAFSQDLDVQLKDEFQPFLYPMQYCWYTEDSPILEYGMRISEQSADDLDYISNVYHDIISSVTYDQELARNISADYIPDPNATLRSRTGVCFDFASLMTALLRSQGIPTKLVTGYSGNAYHAWVSVYTDQTGWIDNMIEFDGSSWTLMDPTLAAGNSEDSVGKYIGDGSNYQEKYDY